MRIATSTIYDQQTASIDDLNAQYAQIGNELSTGKQLLFPSDNPAQIAQDLGVRNTIAQQTTAATNINAATSELTATDSALSTLTNILQKARSIAVQGASDSTSASQRSDLAAQVDQLYTEAIGVANTQYGGKYVFAGTASITAPIVAQGSPTSGVTFRGNLQMQSQIVVDNQAVALSTTIQQAFNYQSTDGSSDVFNVLKTLRDSLAAGAAIDESQSAINAGGGVVSGASAATPSTLGNAPLATPLGADNGTPPSYTVQIDGISPSGTRNIVPLTFTNTTPIDSANPMTPGVVQQINSVTAQTGVSAKFDEKSQRLILSGSTGSFYVTDVPTPGTGATTASNFSKAFNLVQQGDTTSEISRQIGDVDKVLDVALNARSVIGTRINTLSTAKDQNSTSMVDNQKVQSGIEDVDVGAAVSKLSQTQTALQAAYATTTRLESKSLMDYIQ